MGDVNVTQADRDCLAEIVSTMGLLSDLTAEHIRGGGYDGDAAIVARHRLTAPTPEPATQQPRADVVEDAPKAELAELIAMLSAVTVHDGASCFDHSAEEIGIEVMENHKAILTALRTQAPASDEVRELEAAAIDLWEQSLEISQIGIWARCDWGEISERSRIYWRGKALSYALAALGAKP